MEYFCRMLFAGKEKELYTVFSNLPRLAAVTARKFFDRSWALKGFLDKSLKKWKPVRDRKTNMVKQRPLVESGNLRRSIRSRVEGNTAIISTDVSYAEVHNEGGQIKGTVQVSAHKRKTQSGVTDVKAHTRQVDHEMPQRQFMGPSKKLDDEIEEMIFEELDKIFLS